MDKSVPKRALGLMVDGDNGSISEITTTTTDNNFYLSPEPPLEVTHEEHLRTVRHVLQSQPAASGLLESSSSSLSTQQQQQPKRGPSRLVSSLMMKKNHHGSNRHRQAKNVLRDSSQSVASGDGLSLEGVVSLAQTATSHETLKASNMSSSKQPSKKSKGGGGGGGGWHKLKRIMGVTNNNKSSSSTTCHNSTGIGIKQARSFDFDTATAPNKNARARTSESAASVLSSADNNNSNKSDRQLSNNRSRSSPYNKSTTDTNNVDTLEQRIIDDSIRGRRDGIDVIAFGGAQTVSYAAAAKDTKNTDDDDDDDDDDFPRLSFTGIKFDWSPAQIIANVLWNSSSSPEIILDGFVPGGDDRWSVKMERSIAFKNAMSPHLSSIREHQDENKPFYDEDGNNDDGSPALPPQELWSTLWGPDPVPTSLTDLTKFNSNTTDDVTAEDPVLLLAAECSVPIDVDEDTFIVSAPQHLRAIHDIAAVPLAQGNFELVLAIFGKLLKGMDFLENKQLKFLKGTTLHNMAMIYLWRGDFQKALCYFELALNHRSKHLPKNHPDTVVSLVRKGMALFALERFGEAIAAFEIAIPMTHPETLARAKVQNNLGAAYSFHQRESTAALKQFTLSLETQRTWLDSLVRREALVLDAAVTLTNMGRLYMERSEWDLAGTVYEEALLLRTSILRKDEDIVLESMTSLAVAKARSGDMRHALQILQSCTKLKNARLGQGSSSSIETIGLMGYLYMKTEKTEDAGKCLSAVKRWQKANLSPNHPSVLQTNAINTALQESLIEEVWV